jgi:hypothetical protein
VEIHQQMAVIGWLSLVLACLIHIFEDLFRSGTCVLSWLYRESVGA